jgi:hypothetical protein
MSQLSLSRHQHFKTDRPVKQLIDDQMSKPATNLVTGNPCVLECVKPFGWLGNGQQPFVSSK